MTDKSRYFDNIWPIPTDSVKNGSGLIVWNNALETLDTALYDASLNVVPEKLPISIWKVNNLVALTSSAAWTIPAFTLSEVWSSFTYNSSTAIALSSNTFIIYQAGYYKISYSLAYYGTAGFTEGYVTAGIVNASLGLVNRSTKTSKMETLGGLGYVSKSFIVKTGTDIILGNSYAFSAIQQNSSASSINIGTTAPNTSYLSVEMIREIG